MSNKTPREEKIREDRERKEKYRHHEEELEQTDYDHNAAQLKREVRQSVRRR